MTRSKVGACIKALEKPWRYWRRAHALSLAIFFVSATMEAQVPEQSEAPYDQSAQSVHAAAPFSWTGFYVGGDVGWHQSRFDLGSSSDNVTVPLLRQILVPDAISRPVTVAVPGFSVDDSQFLGGGQVGYNQQFGTFVVGFEGDFDGTSLSSSKMAEIHALITPMDIGTFEIQRSVKTDWMASTRFRAGFAWQRFLFYGTGGAAFADVSVHAADSFMSPTVSQSASDDAILVGWTAGVGAEWALAKAFSFGLEYRHSDFGNKSFDLESANALLSSQSTKVDFTDDQVTFRVNLHFNGLFGR